MSNRNFRRATWLLPLLMFATPLLLPLAGRTKTKAPTPVVDDPPVSAEFSNIVRQIIVGENRYNIKLMEFSPRVETYVQHYTPDPELGDVVKSDGLFLGRLKFDAQAKEVSFTADPGVETFQHRVGKPTPRLNLNYFAMEPLSVVCTISIGGTTPSSRSAGNTWVTSAAWPLTFIPVTRRAWEPLKAASGWRIMTTPSCA